MSALEVSDYFSRDIAYRLGETYEPPYPLTAGEHEQLEINQAGRSSLPDTVDDIPRVEYFNDEELDATLTWVKIATEATVNEELNRAALTADLDYRMIHGEKGMPEETLVDIILFFEYGSPSDPLELILSETKPGSPEEILKHLESLVYRTGLFVYVGNVKIIMTAEEYLGKTGK
jgi:hypothetical protein